MINILGVILLTIGVFISYKGVTFRDTGRGAMLTKINIIGAGLLLVVIGFFLFRTDKTMCELLNVFC